MSVPTPTQPPSDPGFSARDLRDPSALGAQLLGYAEGTPLSVAYDRHARALERVPPWLDDGLMSNDPAQHHSKTPQTPAPGGQNE